MNNFLKFKQGYEIGPWCCYAIYLFIWNGIMLSELSFIDFKMLPSSRRVSSNNNGFLYRQLATGVHHAEERRTSLLQEKRQRRKLRVAAPTPVSAPSRMSATTVAETAMQESDFSATAAAARERTTPRAQSIVSIDGRMPTTIQTGFISVTQWRSRRFNIQYFPARYVGLRLNYETYSFYIAPCNGLQGAVAQYAANPARNTGANPFSFR